MPSNEEITHQPVIPAIEELTRAGNIVYMCNSEVTEQIFPSYLSISNLQHPQISQRLEH
jgi:hypothetical protein